jgi:hypothetical protein
MTGSVLLSPSGYVDVHGHNRPPGIVEPDACSSTAEFAQGGSLWFPGFGGVRFLHFAIIRENSAGDTLFQRLSYGCRRLCAYRRQPLPVLYRQP